MATHTDVRDGIMRGVHEDVSGADDVFVAEADDDGATADVAAARRR